MGFPSSVTSGEKKSTFFQAIKAATPQACHSRGAQFVLHFEMIKTVTLANLDTFQVSKGFKLGVFWPFSMKIWLL